MYGASIWLQTASTLCDVDYTLLWQTCTLCSLHFLQQQSVVCIAAWTYGMKQRLKTNYVEEKRDTEKHALFSY